MTMTRRYTVQQVGVRWQVFDPDGKNYCNMTIRTDADAICRRLNEALAPQRKEEPNIKLQDTPSFAQAIQSISSEHIAMFKTLEEIGQMFFHKMGGMPSENSIEQFVKYFEDQRKILMSRIGPPPSESFPISEPNAYLDDLKEALEEIAGVTGVQPLLNDYPATASIIIKINTNNLTEDETLESMSLIQDTIMTMKPPELEQIEVIYHSKEVYR